LGARRNLHDEVKTPVTDICTLTFFRCGDPLKPEHREVVFVSGVVPLEKQMGIFLPLTLSGE